MNIYIIVAGGLFIVYGLVLLIFDRRKRAKTNFFLRKNPWLIILLGVVAIIAYIISYYIR